MERRGVIKNRIRELREQKKWSVSQMGNKLISMTGNDSPRKLMYSNKKTGNETVIDLESGQTNLTIELVIAYADIFGVTVDYIVGRSNSE